MIYSLRGTVVHKEIGLIVVECGGVGFACRTTYNTLSQVELGKETFLYTHMSVREDAMELFGFAKQQELNCFRMLLTVTGVGPKAALSVLSDVSPEKFALTVATGDHKALTKIKGIGPKMAQRIVLELKDKIAKEQQTAGFSADDLSDSIQTENSSIGEALSALVVLGYSQGEANSVLAKLDPALSTEELIRQALKSIASAKLK